MNAVAQKDSFAHYELAGPATLAEQPVRTDWKVESAESWWPSTFTHLESRYGVLRDIRWSWWAYWATLAEYVLPVRYKWLIVANQWLRGGQVNQAIIDDTGTLAMRICAAGIADGFMPETRPWFNLTAGLPGYQMDADAKEWYEDTEQRVYTVLAQSNFYTTMAQAARDVTVFATAPVICYEDAEDVIRCYIPCAGEYYLGAGSRFSVDTMIREFTLTVAQIIEMFGTDNCSIQVLTLWAAGGASLDREFVILHSIEPNFAIAPRGEKPITPVPSSFTFREVYWLKGVRTEKPLSVRGFNERPFAVVRWSTVSNDAYGRDCPAMDALGDIKQLQLEQARKLEGIEKQVRPPMVADARMKNEPSSILPGHITYVPTDGGQKMGFWPAFEVQPNLVGMTADIKETQERIKEAFLVDVFNAITDMEGVQPRNDMEIQERRAEKLQRLGPIGGIWKTEFASPLLHRIIQIMLRRGLLKPLPPSLRGVPLKIEYMDMITLAQLGAQTASMERTAGVAGNAGNAAQAAGLPNPIRIINWDKFLRIYGEKVKFPTEAIYSEDEVKRQDAARAQEAQKQQAVAAAPQMVDAAKNLSQTDVGNGQSALQALVGQR